MKAVHILKNGEMVEIEITSKDHQSQLLEKSKSQGNGDLKDLYSWSYEGLIITCYGWYDGEAGFENKHELPSGGKSRFLDTDSANQLLFGDIFIISMKKNVLVDLEISDYGEFYSLMFGGFDDCESDSDLSEASEDISEEEEIVEEESEEEPIEIYTEDDSELEYDESEY
tara:strand:- start:645 stop:1154 length:510 start_codon:yes stop_codon:yes gene_type:complete